MVHQPAAWKEFHWEHREAHVSGGGHRWQTHQPFCSENTGVHGPRKWHPRDKIDAGQ